MLAHLPVPKTNSCYNFLARNWFSRNSQILSGLSAWCSAPSVSWLVPQMFPNKTSVDLLYLNDGVTMTTIYTESQLRGSNTLTNLGARLGPLVYPHFAIHGGSMFHMQCGVDRAFRYPECQPKVWMKRTICFNLKRTQERGRMVDDRATRELLMSSSMDYATDLGRFKGNCNEVGLLEGDL